MRAELFAALLLFGPVPALAQGALLQAGVPVSGQVPMYSGTGTQAVVQTSGPAGGGGVGLGLTELLQVNRITGTGPNGAHVCLYDHPTTNAAGYHYFCLDAGADNRALMEVGNGGGAAAQTFQFIVNGTAYDFPFAVGGIVGPNTTTIGHLALWNNVSGTLLKDGGDVTQTVSITPPSDQGGLIVTQHPNVTFATAPIYYNYITIDDSENNGSWFKNGLGIIHNYGGSTSSGGIQSLAVYTALTSTTSSSNTNHNYVSGFFASAASAPDNGTSMSPKGAFFALNPVAIGCGNAIISGLCNGTPATNLFEVTGGEVNVMLALGSSANYKGGWTIAADPADAVRGTTWDCELCLSNQPGAVNWTDGILLGNMNGQHPIADLGTVLRSIHGIYTNGIDLSTDTISGDAWHSPGAIITGTGAATFTTGTFSGAVSMATLTAGVVVSTGSIAGTGISGTGLAVTGNISAGGGITGAGVTSTGNLDGADLGISGTAGITGLLTLGGQVVATAMATSSGGMCVGITPGGQLYISGVSC